MILSIVRIYPHAGFEHRTLEVLESLRGPTAASLGCLGCSVAVETGEGGAICYLEHWFSREMLDYHLVSPLYARVLQAMECSCRPPEVRFYEVTEVGGLELVEKVRFPH